MKLSVGSAKAHRNAARRAGVQPSVPLAVPASAPVQQEQCSTSYSGYASNTGISNASWASHSLQFRVQRSPVACAASASVATVTKKKGGKNAAKGASKNNAPAVEEIPRGETAGATLVVEGVTVQAGDRDLLTVRCGRSQTQAPG